MPEHPTEKPPLALWHVPVVVDEVPAMGRHFDLVADANVRRAVARLADLRDMPRLEAHFDVRRRGATGLHVTGRVSATVGQTCVVTLEPIANEVDEEVDLLFEPSAQPVAGDESNEADAHNDSWDEHEPLINGTVDLGALATEFLVLGLDPYPRKPGAVFQPPQDATPDEGPFAALGALKKDRDGR
jgi:uncharacterized metal-binding protein YceD (DUF177 family)